jgi:glycine/serine hydroxymethyltransferase
MPAMTTRGVMEDDTRKIVDFIDQAIKARDYEATLADLKNQVKEFALIFPVP